MNDLAKSQAFDCRLYLCILIRVTAFLYSLGLIAVSWFLHKPMGLGANCCYLWTLKRYMYLTVKVPHSELIQRFLLCDHKDNENCCNDKGVMICMSTTKLD